MFTCGAAPQLTGTAHRVRERTGHGHSQLARGDLRIGPVTLSAGNHVRAGFDAAVPVAWVTRQKVPDAGRVWAALSDARPETGLVSFLRRYRPS